MSNKLKSLFKKLSKFGYQVRSKADAHYDPVCGMKATGELISSSNLGQTYYFCSDHCKRQFDANPANFIS